MADFRKSFLLASLSLAVGLGATGVASAQTTCSLGAPTVISAEGQAEELPVQVTCNGAVSGPFSFSLIVGATITNDFTAQPPTITGTLNGGAISGITVTSVGPTTVQFSNLPASGAGTFFVSGLRVDATTVAAGVAGLKPITATIVPTGSTGAQLPTPTNNGSAIAYAMPSLTAPTVTVATDNTAPSFTVGICTGNTINGGSANNFFTAKFGEGYSGGLRTAGQVGPGGTGPTPGPTEVAVVFNGVPSGVTMYVPISILASSDTTGSGASLALASGEGSTTLVKPGDTGVTGNNAKTDPANVPPGYIAVTSGTTVFYNTNHAAVTAAARSFSFTVFPVGAPTAVSSTTPTMAISLAPISTDANQGAALPRYASTPLTVATVAIATTTCQTSLLFPYLVNTAGFDTGVTIAATGTDPFKTAAPGGTCTIWFYGTSAPTTAPTVTVPTAGNGAFIVSNVAPGFDGYAIAVCTFQYAHGYAFITNGFDSVGGPTVAQGYLAPVITDRNASTSTGSGNFAGGEGLSQ